MAILQRSRKIASTNSIGHSRAGWGIPKSAAADFVTVANLAYPAGSKLRHGFEASEATPLGDFPIAGA